jgi:hypothetical protein
MSFKIGDRVVIVRTANDGLYKGMEGTITEISGSYCRYRVRIDETGSDRWCEVEPITKLSKLLKDVD